MIFWHKRSLYVCKQAYLYLSYVIKVDQMRLVKRYEFGWLYTSVFRPEFDEQENLMDLNLLIIFSEV